MVSFRGNVVDSASVDYYKFKKVNVRKPAVKRKAPSAVYPETELKIKKMPTSFVELNPFSDFDKAAVMRTEKIWGRHGEYMPFMASMFDYKGDSTTDVNTRFFALTDQLEDFDYLNPEHFLGMAQATKLDDGKVSVDALQVNPFYLFNNPYSDIKHIGETICKCLEKVFYNAELILFSPRKSVPFFELNGYEIRKTPANKDEICMVLQNTMKAGLKK